MAQDRATHKIYVADAGQGYLVELSPEGKLTGETAELPTDRPYGLDLDAEGNFYVGAQDTREVVRFRVICMQRCFGGGLVPHLANDSVTETPQYDDGTANIGSG